MRNKSDSTVHSPATADPGKKSASGKARADQPDRIAEVPSWPFAYISSFKALSFASPEQARFYKRFKASFLKAEYIDLRGNSNYAFVLMHYILHNFKYDKSKQTEKQLEQLGQYYPVVKKHAISQLMGKLRRGGKKEALDRLRDQQTTYYKLYASDEEKQPEPDYWYLGSRFQSKLKLDKEQVQLLDHIFLACNFFNDIEHCLLQVIGLFLETVRQLDEQFVKEKTTLHAQFLELSTAIVAESDRKRARDFGKRFSFLDTPEMCSIEFYNILFKHCQNAVREQYGCEPEPVYPIFYIHEPTVDFEKKILVKAKPLMKTYCQQLPEPGNDVQIELNGINPLRWRNRFDQLVKNYDGNARQFGQDISALAD